MPKNVKCLMPNQWYESRLVEEYAFNRNNKIFTYIKRIMKSDFLPKVMHLDTRSVSSDSDKAFLFNLFFESIYSKPLSNTLQDHDSAQQQATLDCINITDMDVLTALTNLDPSEARARASIG